MTRREREIQRLAIRITVTVGAIVGMAGVVMAGVIIVTPPSHGTVSVKGNEVTYTPKDGYVGLDNFTYKHTGINPIIVPQGQTELVFDETPREYVVPVTLTVNPDGTREVVFGEPLN